MLKKKAVAIADVYVPVKRRQTLDPHKSRSWRRAFLREARTAPFSCGQTAAGMCWWKGCIDWKPAGRLVRRLCPPISFRPGSIDMTVTGHAPEAMAQVKRGAVIGRCEGTKERRAK